jgi:hypothetical protein
VVRAPGPALLRIDLRSPDGSIRLPTSTVPVSASTISGVGAALSVVSLLFLAGWWISTTRRKRRAAARMRRRHPAVVPDDDPEPEPAAAAVGGDSRSGADPTGTVEPGG